MNQFEKSLDKIELDELLLKVINVFFQFFIVFKLMRDWKICSNWSQKKFKK